MLTQTAPNHLDLDQTSRSWSLRTKRTYRQGVTGESKHPAAPRFRRLDDQTNLSKLSNRIREGHEGMPLFRFDRDDADAMVIYIRSIQSP
jgi:hypothetical protein